MSLETFTKLKMELARVWNYGGVYTGEVVEVADDSATVESTSHSKLNCDLLDGKKPEVGDYVLFAFVKGDPAKPIIFGKTKKPKEVV